MAVNRYRNVGVIDDMFYETVDFPTKKELDEINYVRIRRTRFDRLDILAHKHLGSGEYWWIIVLVNDLDWPYTYTDGEILKIPVDVQDVLRFF